MKNPLEQVGRYLRETLGITVDFVPWERSQCLPLFLQDRYAFYQAEVLEIPCVIASDQGEHGESPAAIRKHLDHLRERTNAFIIYVRQNVTAYNRKRLIEQRIPFIVPGNQLYLPMLGIDLREHFRRQQQNRSKFRPSSQAILIHMLLSDATDFGKNDLTPQFGYSSMTISRAFDELEAADLVKCKAAGRERRLWFTESKIKVWNNAQLYLCDPVQRRYWIQESTPRERVDPEAGLTALAKYTTLAEPVNRIVAMGRKEWRLRQNDELQEMAAGEPGALQVEVWSYSPAFFAVDGVVDRLSLYLCLKNTKDERVESALEAMMGDQQW